MIANDFGLDFERIRSRARAQLPACRRPARRRVRRRPVPVQGHDAARRVQQQQLHARPRQHDDQRGPPALPRRPARAALRPRHDDASASSAWRSRPSRDDIRSSLSYKLKRILRFKAARGALHRPVRHRSTPTSCRSTTCSHESDLLIDRHAARASTPTSRPTRPGRRHLEPARRRGAGVTPRGSRSSSRSTTRATRSSRLRRVVTAERTSCRSPSRVPLGSTTPRGRTSRRCSDDRASIRGVRSGPRTAPVRETRSALRHRHAVRTSRARCRRHHGRRQRRPRADRRALQARRAGRRWSPRRRAT